ncbi:MAG: hypothetical protein CVT63_07325 [Candidatus Anoxymicrobium japonicum]|uniref:AB hydrolase-1 domain-containing protein n=1 Tax=Candidatus Anoxymicrobium japonicum TaxID=2013648 RepID=A0A2N3G4A8_9ACTN|nr:MAG: hypothetical protein CVT63_07325 [Candidatus Anoxymicrobium japonicum]
MNTVQVGDINIAYNLTGDGAPLVMIQGLTATMDWWDPEFVDALSQRYRVLTFDNRGTERTATPDGEFTIEQFADDTIGLMDALGIERALILGFSMGGMIAQEIALSHHAKIEKLVLCSTSCGGAMAITPSREILTRLLDRNGTPDELVERFMSLLFSRGWIDENRLLIDDFKKRYMLALTPERSALRQFMATVKFKTHERLGQIAAPTLVMYGADDILIPAENSKILVKAIPGAGFIEYPDSGHGFLWQCRQKCLRDLIDFLD